MIKNLIPALAERGKIKIGDKGKVRTSRTGKEFAPPEKLDHFRITTLERDEADRLIEDKELTAKLAPAGGAKLTEIPIRLLYDSIDLNFNTWYAAYAGQRLWCSGDGEKAQRLNPDGKGRHEIKCPCEHLDVLYDGPQPCKFNGKLSCIIEGAGRIGGVWTFRTTSFNSVNAILSSLALIKTLTGGYLSGLPLRLVVGPKRVTIPKTGETQKVFVVTVEYPGEEAELLAIAEDVALKRKTHLVRMNNLELEARKLLELQSPAETESPQEIVPEFYPEEIERELAQQNAGESAAVTAAKAAGDDKTLKIVREQESIEALQGAGAAFVHTTDKEGGESAEVLTPDNVVSRTAGAELKVGDAVAETPEGTVVPLNAPPKCSAEGCEDPAYLEIETPEGEAEIFFCPDHAKKAKRLLFTEAPKALEPRTYGAGLDAVRVNVCSFAAADLEAVKKLIPLKSPVSNDPKRPPDTGAVIVNADGSTTPTTPGPADPNVGAGTIPAYNCLKCKFPFPADEPKCPECGTPKGSLF